MAVCLRQPVPIVRPVWWSGSHGQANGCGMVTPTAAGWSAERQLRLVLKGELRLVAGSAATPAGDGIDPIRRERTDLAVPGASTHHLDGLRSVAVVDHPGPGIPTSHRGLVLPRSLRGLRRAVHARSRNAAGAPRPRRRRAWPKVVAPRSAGHRGVGPMSERKSGTHRTYLTQRRE